MTRLFLFSLMVGAFAHASGCVFIDDFGKFQLDADGEVQGDGQVEDDGSVETDAEVQPNLECVDQTLDGSSAGASPTTEGPDRRAASCGGASAPEKIFAWTAPYTDFYRFHTTGSSFETVLYLLDGDCDGAEVACSDEQVGTYRTELVRYVEEGERVLVVVDGRSGDSGDAVVTVEPVSCPDIQLTDAILPVTHSTAGRDPYPGMTCTDGSHGARTYRYTAPAEGHYSFLAKRTAFGWRPSIRLEEGPICGGAAIQCGGGGSDADTWPLGSDGRAEVLRHLAVGEHVTVIVSGYDGEGEFELDVTETGHASCIDHTLQVDEGSLPYVFDTTLPLDGPHRMTNSCGQASVTDYDGTLHPQPDLNVRIDLPPPPGTGCFQSCDALVETGFRFFASVADLDDASACAAAERSCLESQQISPDGPPQYERWVSLHADGKPKLLTIDRRLYPYQGGAYYDPTESQVDVRITVDCGIACS